MRKASSVNVGVGEGSYNLYVGGDLRGSHFVYSPPARIIEAIEVHVEEYPDHVDTIINIMSGGKIARQLINCPVDILYQA